MNCCTDSIVYCGYEVPKNIHRLTKKVLRKLAKYGIALVDYDDQFGRVAMEQLEEIAPQIGLRFAHVCNHQFFIADECFTPLELESTDNDHDNRD